MSSSTSPAKLLTTDSNNKQSSYDSSRTDSGFLSGVNLVSEENLSSDDLCQSRLFESKTDKGHKSLDTCMQIDSGVDVGLNEQFSGLTLDQKLGVRDLIESSTQSPTRKSGVVQVTGLGQTGTHGTDDKATVVSQPWELYFQQDEDGDTQLHIAIIQGFIEVVFSLTKMVPHPCFLDILNDVIQSPLHLAVLTHQSQIVRHLVVAGACVEARDRHGNTPLHLACQIGDLDSVKALTEPVSVSEIAAANLSYSGFAHQVPQDFEERNYEGETCLHLAAYGGHMEILRHLIWFGADINARESKSGRTVLHYAVETSNHKLLRFLLDECPFGPNGLVLDTENYAGHTAYQLARIVDLKMARDLVSRGAHASVDDLDEDEHPDHNADEMDDEDSDEEMESRSSGIQVPGTQKEALSA